MGIGLIRPIINKGVRIAKVLPEAVFGNGAEVAGKAIREANNTLNTTGKQVKASLYTKAKAGFLALEKDITNKQKLEGNFLKRITSNIGEITRLPKAEYQAAKLAGKSGIWAGTKGFFKGISKNMPFIGAVTTLLFELPNIFTATKEQGIGQGVKETLKAGSRLVGGATGAVIGSAICPGIGTMIGWVVGDMLTGMVVGKSYTEKKAEQLAELEEAMVQTQNKPQQTGAPSFNGQEFNETPYYQNPMYAYNNGLDNYSDDIMMQGMNFNGIA